MACTVHEILLQSVFLKDFPRGGVHFPASYPCLNGCYRGLLRFLNRPVPLPHSRAGRRVREWYRSVQEAQEAAVAAVQAGVTCGEVDAAARDVLKKNGLEQYFVHSTGHGLGLEVHEEPRIARGQTVRLEAGNVITIEPGVYVEGVGGIRIEDDVVVETGRNEVLTRVKRDLIEL